MASASGAWRAAAWTTAAAVWGAATWSNCSTFCGYPAEPVYYDYGSNVVYEGDTFYVNGESAGSQEQYAQQAIVLADTGRQAEASKEEEWIALGVFAMVQGERTDGNDLFQLAVNKAGTIRGNFYNALSDTTMPVYGAVDKDSQRRRLDGRRPQGANLRGGLRQPDQGGNHRVGAFRQGPQPAVDFSSDRCVRGEKVIGRLQACDGTGARKPWLP